jgi:hypothetical protein
MSQEFMLFFQDSNDDYSWRLLSKDALDSALPCQNDYVTSLKINDHRYVAVIKVVPPTGTNERTFEHLVTMVIGMAKYPGAPTTAEEYFDGMETDEECREPYYQCLLMVCDLAKDGSFGELTITNNTPDRRWSLVGLN